jgi:hypothetical protein
MEDIFATILTVLADQWIWDVAVFTNPWMYYPLLIPIAFFVPFFFAKWMILTTPVWIPIYIVLMAFRRR